MDTQKKTTAPRHGNGGARQTTVTGDYTSHRRRIDFAEVREAMRGQWQDYHASIGIDAAHLTRRHGSCPACGGKDRFRCDNIDGRGTWICNQCGAGDGFDLAALITGQSKAEVLLDVAAWLGLDSDQGCAPARRRPPPITTPKVDSDKYRRQRETADRILSQCQYDHPLLWTYTQARGLSPSSIPVDIRLHSACNYYHDGRLVAQYPAMVAIIRNLAGQIVGLHRTYLRSDGTGKAAVASAKKMMSLWAGSTSGGAVRLADAADGLIVCEGIETGLALLQTTGEPVWCALSAGGLERVDIPATVREVVIAGDNDSARTGQGEKSARALADRLRRSGFVVKIMIPPEPGDWLDVLTKETRHD